jgi:dihydroxyacetone kinase DhaKLM complex PTS-EIIA-like component DhaM
MHNERKFLGRTTDTVRRVVDVFADHEKMYAIYDIGTADEYIAEESINKVKANPDKYIYTPYAEFAEQV